MTSRLLGFLLATVCMPLLDFQILAADPPAKRLLLVTHSGGFIHDSVGVAEDVLKAIGPKYGFEVTCYRYTGDPSDPKFPKYQNDFRARTGKTVEPENCGRINKDTLSKFDVVLFFTTGSGPKRNNIAPMNESELKDFVEWLRAGGAFAGAHCASDTLYDSIYGEVIGGYFRTHPPGLHNIKIRIEDPKHPAAAGFENGQEYRDEIYIFQDKPYSRDRLRIIMSCEPGSFKEAKSTRADGDYALSWCRTEGKGKVFYTAFGHQKAVWQDERFQKHLFGGLKWVTNQVPGESTPTGSSR